MTEPTAEQPRDSRATREHLHDKPGVRERTWTP
jgi:hypothetical protein